MRSGVLFARTTQGTVGRWEMAWQEAQQHVSRGIFISHKREDLLQARHVGHEIMLKTQVPCYIDELDPNVEGDSPDLVIHIQEVIHHCRSLLAVVSKNTQNSWWVPLEIGVALESQKFIGSYNTDRTELPSYLWSWPTMNATSEAVEWARAAKRYSSADQLHRAWRSRNPRRVSDRVNLYSSL